MPIDTPTTLKGWCELLSDWEHQFVKRNGEIVGCAFIKGDEVHCWREPSAQGQWGSRNDLIRIVGAIITKYGHVKTKVMKSNDIGHKFVTRLGFFVTGEDEFCIHYKAERLKHARF